MEPAAQFDAVVVGAGPNGLAAAIRLAQRGRSVCLFEAAPTIGGGCRTAELTLPGCRHDVCSAVHPLAAASPFFESLPLLRHGLAWLTPPVAVAHPLDDAPPALLWNSLTATAAGLGRDGAAYYRLLAPLVAAWPALRLLLLAPLLRWPAQPLATRHLLPALLPARWLAELAFRTPAARALWAGLAAHAVLPLERTATSGVALLLALLGHRVGWPLPLGGSQRLVDALAAELQALGGRIVTGYPIDHLDQLPASALRLCNVTPRQLVALAGQQLPAGYRQRLLAFRHGPGVFKVDWLIDGPIPWRWPACRLAGTVHLGGTLAEIAAAEAAVWHGWHPARPFVLLAQPSQFDASRAPAGRQVVWAYCHVPAGSTVDSTAAIEAQIERFAPGFSQRILARHSLGPAALERYNANYIGGDISGGSTTLGQLLARPIASPEPYVTPVAGLYLCSASTPPGGGVHGMCGYHAAEAALRRQPAAR